ncbi:MAG: rhodanese-like domain-containing protein, partial [Candidatus Limnocylindrales bacterium]
MTKTFAQLLREARSVTREVSNDDAQALADRGALLVDVRESEEWAEGHLPGAVFVPRGYLESRIEAAAPDRERPMVVYCAGGTRSAFAAQQLQDMGYRDVVNMVGGFQSWKAEGRPWTRPARL